MPPIRTRNATMISIRRFIKRDISVPNSRYISAFISFLKEQNHPYYYLCNLPISPSFCSYWPTKHDIEPVLLSLPTLEIVTVGSHYIELYFILTSSTIYPPPPSFYLMLYLVADTFLIGRYTLFLGTKDRACWFIAYVVSIIVLSPTAIYHVSCS